MGKASMSFLTALSLSFNNLRTKKGRTILTSFAGSIGIIGIALILSLSTGVNTYIDDIQKDTMVSYPVTIEAVSFDLESMLSSGHEQVSQEVEHSLDAVYSNTLDLEMASKSTSNLKENNLSAFKTYLDDPNNEIHQYIGEYGIVYSYDVSFDTYTYDPEGELVNTDGSEFKNDSSYGMNDGTQQEGLYVNMGFFSSSNFDEILPGSDDNLISSAITDSYEVLYGNWPKAYDELVVVLDLNNEISSSTLYELGLLPSSEYKEILKGIENGEDMEFKSKKFTYEELAKQTFYMVPASDYYLENDDGLFDYIADDKEKFEDLLENALELKIVGVIRPMDADSYSPISRNIGYTKALTDYIIDYNNKSPVVKAQIANPDENVINGMSFEPENDKEKVDNTIEYLTGLGISEKAKLSKNILSMAYASDPETAESMLELDETELAAMLDQYLLEPEDETLLMIYDTNISPGNYDNNLTAFGYVSLDAPSSISLYADNFENKDTISSFIEKYNETATIEDQISYTDYVKLLMSSVTTIVNVITYVLVAFVAVSLIVSSIMIGIITFISVLERTKEIGILRSIGASKRNISQVFNAETFIIGLLSGLIGIGTTLLLLIPGNMLIHSIAGTTDVNAALPAGSAVFLIVLSMILTVISGIIPSKKAAKQDPVEALRND